MRLDDVRKGLPSTSAVSQAIHASLLVFRRHQLRGLNNRRSLLVTPSIAETCSAFPLFLTCALRIDQCKDGLASTITRISAYILPHLFKTTFNYCYLFTSIFFWFLMHELGRSTSFFRFHSKKFVRALSLPRS